MIPTCAGDVSSSDIVRFSPGRVSRPARGKASGGPTAPNAILPAPGPEPGPPSADVGAIVVVGRPELPSQRGLLVQDDEGRERDPHDGRVAEEHDPAQEERLADDR